MWRRSMSCREGKADIEILSVPDEITVLGNALANTIKLSDEAETVLGRRWE